MQMNKGMISTLVLSVVWAVASATAHAEGEIYKVVDADGNVTYTDQRPSAGAQPLDLPPLSVVQTEEPDPVAPPDTATGPNENAEPTLRDLQAQFRDFRISRPAPEETFWGTANTVVVAWESAQPIPPDLRVTLYVDGQAQQVADAGSVTLTLDRGEHQVYAELRDQRNRRVAGTETVTFFVKQASVRG
jgi:hypothetical protein